MQNPKTWELFEDNRTFPLYNHNGWLGVKHQVTHSQVQKQNRLVSFCGLTLMLGSSASPACPCGLVWPKQRSIWTLKHQNRLKLWYKSKANLYRKWAAVYDVVVVFPLDLWLHCILVSTHKKGLTFCGCCTTSQLQRINATEARKRATMWIMRLSECYRTQTCVRVTWLSDVILILNPKACCPQVHLPHYGPAGGGSAPCRWPLRVRQEYLVYSFAKAAGRCSALVRVCFDSFRSSGDFKK